MDEKNVNLLILKSLFENRLMIVMTILGFVLLSICVNFMIPKKFTSSAIVYPNATNSIDELVIDPSFGFEIQADRTIQLFESQMMKDKLVKKFNLIGYYELDTTSSEWYAKLSKNYSKDITFSRTKYQSVLIRVNMKDPFLAADIANTAVNYLDTIQKNLFVENLIEIKHQIELNVSIQQQEIDQVLLEILMSDTLGSSSNPVSTNKLNQIKFQHQIGQAQAGDDLIIQVLEKYPSFEIEKKINDYYIKLGALNELKKKLANVEETIKLPFPGVYIISRALPDKTPTSPILFWNIIFGFLIGMVVSVGYLIAKVSLGSIRSSLKQ